MKKPSPPLYLVFSQLPTAKWLYSCGGRARDSWQYLLAKSCRLDLELCIDSSNTTSPCQRKTGLHQDSDCRLHLADYIRSFCLAPWAGLLSRECCSCIVVKQSPACNCKGHAISGAQLCSYTTLLSLCSQVQRPIAGNLPPPIMATATLSTR